MLTICSPLFVYSDIETIGWLGMWLMIEKPFMYSEIFLTSPISANWWLRLVFLIVDGGVGVCVGSWRWRWRFRGRWRWRWLQLCGGFACRWIWCSCATIDPEYWRLTGATGFSTYGMSLTLGMLKPTNIGWFLVVYPNLMSTLGGNFKNWIQNSYFNLNAI
jgi:hypothetical protein